MKNRTWNEISSLVIICGFEGNILESKIILKWIGDLKNRYIHSTQHQASHIRTLEKKTKDNLKFLSFLRHTFATSKKLMQSTIYAADLLFLNLNHQKKKITRIECRLRRNSSPSDPTNLDRLLTYYKSQKLSPV